MPDSKQQLNKIIARPLLVQEISRRKLEGKKVVFTNGCFDLLHVGHVRYLVEAAAAGDILVVGLNSDNSVRLLKGPQRPLVPEAERAELLAALSVVDYVCIFPEETPRELICQIKPDILIKGGDYQKEELAGGKEVESWGGKVILAPEVKGKSTRWLIEKIIQRYGEKTSNGSSD